MVYPGRARRGWRCRVEVLDGDSEERLTIGTLVNFIDFQVVRQADLGVDQGEYYLVFDAGHRWRVGLRRGADGALEYLVVNTHKPEWLDALCFEPQGSSERATD